MIPASRTGFGPDLTPAQLEALDDLYHQCDLISTRPLRSEIAWTLDRASSQIVGLDTHCST